MKSKCKMAKEIGFYLQKMLLKFNKTNYQISEPEI